MHLLATETVTLDEGEAAVDLGLTPADMLVLAHSDSDLATLAAAHARLAPGFSLRAVQLAKLKHPYSVDLMVEQLAARAKVILVRVLGGRESWPYGLDELHRMAKRKGIRLAVLTGEPYDDPRLDALSTVPPEDLARLLAWLRAGGPDNLASLLGFVGSWMGLNLPVAEPKPMAAWGGILERSPSSPLRGPSPARGEGGAWGTVPSPLAGEGGRRPGEGDLSSLSAPHALIIAYRALVLAEDLKPVVALADALAAQGLRVTALHVSSLKDPEVVAGLGAALPDLAPDIILNTTAFSARLGSGGTVLDAACCPILQVPLSTGARAAWAASPRGLSATDLAMNVVLPEVDGRTPGPPISFKGEAERLATLEFTRIEHQPDDAGILHVAELAARWVRLAKLPHAEKRLALVVPDYPGRPGRAGRAVGLDTWASVEVIAALLRDAGYAVGEVTADVVRELEGRGESASPSSAPSGHLLPGGEKGELGARSLSPQRERVAEGRVRGRDRDQPSPALPLSTYLSLFAALPEAFRASVIATWGEPSEDFHFAATTSQNLTIALQPDRGRTEDREASYHDPALPPCHRYIAFHLWLRHVLEIDALVHLGTHGTLEWLPGKAVALSEACGPRVLLGPTPVVYPFIVNNPGEAAHARRRLQAVTLGHMTPPLVEAGLDEAGAEIETLMDEYAGARALDPRRARLAARAILTRAEETGLGEEAGISGLSEDEALSRLDAWLCDLKERRIGDGLHIFGAGSDPACAAGERAGLLAALAGRFVPPGPSGAPSPRRQDVLPTGRNLYAVDPRAIPTPTAYEMGRQMALDVMTRHAQDHGDWPKSLVIDLWGSSSMRTGGEDFAQGLALMGVKPVWDGATGRIVSLTILPPASLDHPRVDVTLRVSGLFRDVFAEQIALFDTALRHVAALDEAADVNPLAAAIRDGGNPLRVFGAAPGAYGMGVARALDADLGASEEALARRYLDASAHAYGRDSDGLAMPEAFAARVASAEAFVHVEDLEGRDILDAPAFGEHEGGFAAAARLLGANPALYHVEGQGEAAKVNTLGESVAKAVRTRAANPRWIQGQMRHGHRGGAEIAETVSNIYLMAVTTQQVKSSHFDAIFDKVLGTDDVLFFLQKSNPLALSAIVRTFRAASERGIWKVRRNSARALLEDLGSQDSCAGLGELVGSGRTGGGQNDKTG